MEQKSLFQVSEPVLSDDGETVKIGTGVKVGPVKFLVGTEVSGPKRALLVGALETLHSMIVPKEKKEK